MTEYLGALLAWTGALLLAAWAWIFAHTNSRLRRLEEAKADMKYVDLNIANLMTVLNQHIEDDRTMHAHVVASVDAISSKLDVTNSELTNARVLFARVAARLNGPNKDDAP